MSTTEIEEHADIAETAAAEERTLPPVERGSDRRGTGESLAFFAVGLAGMALVAAVISIGIALRAVETAEDRVAAASAAAATGPVTVTLSDFAITPAEIELVAGSTLEVINDGATVHNLEVEGLRSPDIPAGGTVTFDVSSLAPGSYELICQIPGHKDLGMVATLTVI
jgi:uncharacterized cupredoxin-like copper-binding protein